MSTARPPQSRRCRGEIQKRSGVAAKSHGRHVAAVVDRLSGLALNGVAPAWRPWLDGGHAGGARDRLVEVPTLPPARTRFGSAALRWGTSTSACSTVSQLNLFAPSAGSGSVRLSRRSRREGPRPEDQHRAGRTIGHGEPLPELPRVLQVEVAYRSAPSQPRSRACVGATVQGFATAQRRLRCLGCKRRVRRYEGRGRGAG